jgi:hypothetical protein
LKFGEQRGCRAQGGIRWDAFLVTKRRFCGVWIKLLSLLDERKETSFQKILPLQALINFVLLSLADFISVSLGI